MQPCSVFCPAGGYMAGQTPRPVLEDITSPPPPPPFLALPPPPPSQDFDPLDYDGEKAKKAMKVKKVTKADAEKDKTKAQKAAKEK